MKGWVKGCLITALICTVVGFITLVAGVTSVGTETVRHYLIDGEFSFVPYDIWLNEWHDEEDDDWNDEDADRDEERKDWDDVAIGGYSADESYIPDTDGEVVETASGIRKLDVEFDGGALYLTEDDSVDEIQVSVNSHQIAFDCYREQDTLKFKDKGNHRIGEYNEREVVIRIPSGFVFDEVELEMGGGLLTIDNLEAGKVELDAGAGEVSVGRLKAEKADLDIGAGELVIENGTVKNASVEVGVGHALYQGTITGELKAECGLGQLEMQLEGSSRDHNYDIESGAGEVSVGGHGYGAGIALEKMIDNAADSNFQLKCGMGSIDLSFAQEE